MSIDESLFQPDSPIPEKLRIFFYVKFHWENLFQKRPGCLFHERIMRETGIKNKSNFNKYVKQLVEEKLIHVQYSEQRVLYELHPERISDSSPLELEISPVDYLHVRESAQRAARMMEFFLEEPKKMHYNWFNQKTPIEDESDFLCRLMTTGKED